MKAALLPDRGVVKVAGDDARKFLNGLLTTDIAKVTPAARRIRRAAHAARQDHGRHDRRRSAGRGRRRLLSRLPARARPTLTDRLNFYKLRAKVLVEDLSEVLGVMAIWDGARETEYGLCYADPRLPALGMRCMLPPHLAAEAAADLGATLVEAKEYEAHRIALGAPRGGLDFQYNDAFPHEADMDQLNGIDFDKGCYVGQEVVSRVEHRGTARKRVVPVTFRGFRAGGRRAGEGRRHRGRRDGLVGAGAADLRCCISAASATRSRPATPIMSGGIALHPVKPAWAQFDWPGEAKAAE